MKISLLLLLLFNLVQFGCSDNTRINQLDNRIASLENRKVSSETAILIAKGEMSTRVDLKNFEIQSVKEGVDYWEVHFISNCKDCLDNQPYVVVNKISGEVVRVYRYGEPAK